jgi:hypothetical protein
MQMMDTKTNQLKWWWADARGGLFRDKRVKALWVCVPGDDGYKYELASVTAALHLLPKAWEKALPKVKALREGSGKRSGDDLDTPSGKRSQSSDADGASGSESTIPTEGAAGGSGGDAAAAGVMLDSPAAGGSGGDAAAARAAVDAAAAACKTAAEKTAVYDAALKAAEDDVEYYKTRKASSQWEMKMQEMSSDDMIKWMELMSQCPDVDEVAKALKQSKG